MKAEQFFSAQQLAAYQLALHGETESLVRQAKALDLNRPGKEGMTLLGLAVLNSDRQAIMALLAAGADPNQVIPDAGSPAILAISKHFNPPSTEAVAALFDGGYDPNQYLSYGTPYLFYFVDYNHWPGLRLAFQRGGNINARSKSGESLLTYVMEGGDFAMARELIAMGADVAARGARGESALRIIEFELDEANPAKEKRWNELLSMRELILSRLQRQEDRRSAFTEAAERKIRENALH